MTDVGVGNRCNSCCVMCTAIMPPGKDYVEPSTEQILGEIDKVEDGSITLTGGEPTIRRDLFRILKYINVRYPEKRIELITNGRMCSYPGFVERLKRVNNLCVITELHAASALMHDEITQSQGSYRETFEGLRNLLEEGFKVEFRIVLSGLNYKEAPELARLVADKLKGLERVVIFPIDLIGNAFVNRDRTLVRYFELAPYVEGAVDVLDKAGVKVELYHIPYCILHEKYHRFIKKGLTVLDRRVVLGEVCNGCRFEEDCPRVWKTYAVRVGTGEFRRVK